MMDGRLEGRAEDDIWIDPPVPKFLDEVAEEHWSEEQKKEVCCRSVLSPFLCR